MADVYERGELTDDQVHGSTNEMISHWMTREETLGFCSRIDWSDCQSLRCLPDQFIDRPKTKAT